MFRQTSLCPPPGAREAGFTGVSTGCGFAGARDTASSTLFTKAKLLSKVGEPVMGEV